MWTTLQIASPDQSIETGESVPKKDVVSTRSCRLNCFVDILELSFFQAQLLNAAELIRRESTRHGAARGKHLFLGSSYEMKPETPSFGSPVGPNFPSGLEKWLLHTRSVGGLSDSEIKIQVPQ